jgi:RimJ/RimL family protein N-acetyltransferase
LLDEGKVMGAAYSSLVSNTGVEMSVVIDPAYRLQGVATLLCALVLQYCLEKQISPHWDAANEESCKLAQKLGYRRLEDYTAYYLKPEN